MSQYIINNINEASKVIGKTWPLYTFVASNPLSGYENAPFEEAVSLAKNNFNANAFPSVKLFQQAFERGDIDKNILVDFLTKQGFS